MKKINCKLCQKLIGSNNFSRHLIRFHQLISENYYQKYINSNNNICQNPKCKCKTKFLGITYGFNKYCCLKCCYAHDTPRNKIIGQKSKLKIITEEIKQKCRENTIKQWKNKTDEQKKIRSEKIRISRLGNKHPLWKGDKVSYGALHDWIKSNYIQPELCEYCFRKKKLEACNISGKYLRDKSDWKWLCRRCHMISDGRLEKFKGIRYNYEK